MVFRDPDLDVNIHSSAYEPPTIHKVRSVEVSTDGAKIAILQDYNAASTVITITDKAGAKQEIRIDRETGQFLRKPQAPLGADWEIAALK